MVVFLKSVFSLLNFLFRKNSKRVVLLPFPNTESGSINIANYLVKNSELQIYFIVEKGNGPIPRKFLHEGVFILEKKHKLDYRYLWTLYRSKYLYLTHGCVLSFFPKSQTVVNLWHGLLYKRVGLLAGGKGIAATYTIGTSFLTQNMLSQAFGVSPDSVLLTGYPRNDNLFKGKDNKKSIKERLNLDKPYQKLILWMPTYRKSIKGDIRLDGTEVGNPFYIQDFDLIQFNNILAENNVVCLIKPHPMAAKYEVNAIPSNVVFIDDAWLYNRGLDLYKFVGATDILISDVSSIVIDYLLVDKPIICISEDFDEYSKSRGFYFNDIEDKIPTKVIRSQDEFFEFLTILLESNVDPFEMKRKQLKDLFFQFQDDKGTHRVVEAIGGHV